MLIRKGWTGLDISILPVNGHPGSRELWISTSYRNNGVIAIFSVVYT
jgi:hypothetical protein